MSREQLEAQEKLIKAVLRRVSSERDEPHANFDDELDYCNDMIFAAAKELVEAPM
jgi:hypothetical protein